MFRILLSCFILLCTIIPPYSVNEDLIKLFYKDNISMLVAKYDILIVTSFINNILLIVVILLSYIYAIRDIALTLISSVIMTTNLVAIYQVGYKTLIDPIFYKILGIKAIILVLINISTILIIIAGLISLIYSCFCIPSSNNEDN